MTQSRAAVFRGINQPLSIETITIDPPGPTEVQVQVMAVGLCHTEMHVMAGERPVAMSPMVLGHEAGGIVEAIGDQVVGVSVGDHVATTWIPACGVCRWCVRGEHHRCVESAKLGAGPQLNGTYRRRDAEGQDVGAFCLVGAFAEITVVDQASVVVVPDQHIPFAAIALSACSAPAAVGAVVDVARVQPTDSALVVGTGGTGMNVVRTASNAGATTVIAVDYVPWKLEMARSMGATATVLAGGETELPAVVAELTEGRGVDHAFVCADPLSMTATALAATRLGGGVVVTAAAPGSATTLSLPPADLIQRQKSVVGSIYGSVSQRRGVPRVLELYRAGRLDLDALVTRTYRLDELNRGYQDLAEGQILRGVLTPQG